MTSTTPGTTPHRPRISSSIGPEPKRALTLATLFMAGFCLLGAYLAWQLVASDVVAAATIGHGTLWTSYLFVAQDGMVAAAFAVLLLACWPLARSRALDRLAALTTARYTLPAIILIGFVASFIARVVAHHSFNLSLDEFLPEFQAEIFRSGRLLMPLSADAFEAHRVFQPFFTYADSTHQLWMSHYRPVHAALIAAFDSIATADLLNPVMAVVALWAIADIARRVFPTLPEAPVLAAALLLATPQFVITNGSGFAFASHLAFNMLWLALFVRGGMRHHIGAAVIGFFAVGLHQVHVHPLFVAPFLAALLLGAYGPRIAVLPYILSYGLALPTWMMWPEIAVFLQTGDVAALPGSIFEIEYVSNYLNYAKNAAQTETGRVPMMTLVNILRFSLWLCPAVLVLMGVALAFRRGMGRTPALCAVSFLLTVFACYILMPNQMHTWGARYYHPVLGAAIIFALAGYAAIKDSGSGPILLRYVTVLSAVSLLVFLPLRGMQVAEKVGPRAAVQARLAAIDADVVVIPTRGLYAGYDFVRNAPDLSNRPLLVFDFELDRRAILQGLDIKYLTRPELFGLGLPLGTFLEPGS